MGQVLRGWETGTRFGLLRLSQNCGVVDLEEWEGGGAGSCFCLFVNCRAAPFGTKLDECNGVVGQRLLIIAPLLPFEC
jgi:hypothetical protein